MQSVNLECAPCCRFSRYLPYPEPQRNKNRLYTNHPRIVVPSRTILALPVFVLLVIHCTPFIRPGTCIAREGQPDWSEEQPEQFCREGIYYLRIKFCYVIGQIIHPCPFDDWVNFPDDRRGLVMPCFRRDNERLLAILT